MEKTCPICKKPFKTYYEPQIFCGMSCYREYRRNRQIKRTGKNVICPICKKTFYLEPYRIKAGAKYCSSSCSAKGTFKKRRILKKFNCAVCGKAVSHMGQSGTNPKYCSVKCRKYAGYWFGSKILKCQRCNKEFTINKGQQYRRKFCSRICHILTQRAMFKVTRRAQDIRRAFERREWIIKCQRCGYDKHKKILGIHHKDRNRRNNKLDNLEVLCPNCHSLEHRKHLIKCQ